MWSNLRSGVFGESVFAGFSEVRRVLIFLYIINCTIYLQDIVFRNFSFAVPGVSNLNAVTDGHRRNMSSRCFLRQKLVIRVVTVDVPAQCLFQYNHFI